jgi:uncharacterized membrane protein HdeD (DUF308 family)
MSSIVSDVNASLSAARKEWGWFLALGIALIALGVAAILYETTSTFASVIALGAIILVAGVMQLFAAFQARGAGHVLLYLLLGALDIVVGFVLIEEPSAGALAVTLVLSVYLMFSGIFRIIYSLWMQFPLYGWAAFAGLVTLALGILLFAQWPTSAFWFLGFAVGVNFILLGTAWSVLAFRLKSSVDSVTNLVGGRS